MKKIDRIKIPPHCGYTSAHIITPYDYVLALFNTWQDLAAEATGHDTEWGYPIKVDRLSQVLQIPERTLIALLTNLA